MKKGFFLKAKAFLMLVFAVGCGHATVAQSCSYSAPILVKNFTYDIRGTSTAVGARELSFAELNGTGPQDYGGASQPLPPITFANQGTGQNNTLVTSYCILTPPGSPNPDAVSWQNFASCWSSGGTGGTSDPFFVARVVVPAGSSAPNDYQKVWEARTEITNGGRYTFSADAWDLLNGQYAAAAGCLFDGAVPAEIELRIYTSNGTLLASGNPAVPLQYVSTVTCPASFSIHVREYRNGTGAVSPGHSPPTKFVALVGIDDVRIEEQHCLPPPCSSATMVAKNFTYDIRGTSTAVGARELSFAELNGTGPQDYGGASQPLPPITFANQGTGQNNTLVTSYCILTPPGSPNPDAVSWQNFASCWSSGGTGGTSDPFFVARVVVPAGSSAPNDYQKVWEARTEITNGGRYTFSADAWDLLNGQYAAAAGCLFDGAVPAEIELRIYTSNGTLLASGNPAVPLQYVSTVTCPASFSIHVREYRNGTGAVSPGHSPPTKFVALVGIDDVRIEEKRCLDAPIASVVPNPLCGANTASISCSQTNGTNLPNGFFYQIYKLDGWNYMPVGFSSTGSGVYNFPINCPVSTLTSTIIEDYYVSIRSTTSSYGSNSETLRSLARVIWYPSVTAPALSWQPPIGVVGSVSVLTATGSSNLNYSWNGPGTFNGSSISYTPPTAGTGAFTVTAVGAGGCPAINNTALPSFALAVASAVSCGSNPIQLQATGTSLPTGYEYRWYDSNNSNSPVRGTATYSAPYAAGCRTISVCIGEINSNLESARITARVTWAPNPINPFTQSPQVIANPFTPMPVIKGVAVMPSFASSALYSWDWGDVGSPSNTNPPPHTYTKVGNYTVTVTATRFTTNLGCFLFNYPCTASFTQSIEVKDLLCETYVSGPVSGSTTLPIKMQQNARDGSFAFIGTGSTCPETEIVWDCISGTHDSNQPSGELRKVVATSAQTLQPAQVVVGYPVEAPGAPLNAAAIALNPFLTGSGFDRPEAGYAYSSSLTGNSSPRQAGRFNAQPFIWGLSRNNRPRRWLAAGVATRHAPSGQAVEERDALDVPSAVRFGYTGQALPYVTGKNAEYDALLFESFESSNTDYPNGVYEAGGGVPTGRTSACAHAGWYSLALPSMLTLPAPTVVPSSWKAQGVRVQAWVRVVSGGQVLSSATWAPPSSSSLTASAIGSGTAAVPLEVVAQSGEWSLCQGVLPSNAWNTGSGVQLNWTGGSGQASYSAWIDDIRLQPNQAQATTYVYDPVTLKLLASFDDQHFGLYYQYDGEGRLVRKQVETMRGKRTVQETHYNTPRTDKD